jgi:D-psicose/D-tagatose/L-ribulose 3-epimerase
MLIHTECMQFGINTFLFTFPFTNDSVRLFPAFKCWGFDAVEIAVDDPAPLDPALIKRALDDAGLACCTVCGAFGPDRDLRGTREQRRASMDYQKRLVDLAVAWDTDLVAGPGYSSVGRAGAETPRARAKQWAAVVKGFQILAAYAQSRGVSLAIEPLNRFETDFLNTIDQSVALCKAIGASNVGIHFDTFHMNIEEKFLPKAILRAGKWLKHVHACGSDRGTPGGDHTDWLGIVAALRKIGYDRAVVIESFTPDVVIIAKAAAIWRQIEPSSEAIARQGVRFLRRAFAKT